MPRKQADRHEQRVAEGMVGTLARTLAASRYIPNDTTGWQIRLFPTIVTLAYETFLAGPDGKIVAPDGKEERLGLAHELVISGSAGKRRRASERWSRAVAFVCGTLAHLPESSPYHHYEIVNGQRHVPLLFRPALET